MKIGDLVKRNDRNQIGIVIKKLKFCVGSDRWSYRIKWFVRFPSGETRPIDSDGWIEESWQLEVL